MSPSHFCSAVCFVIGPPARVVNDLEKWSPPCSIPLLGQVLASTSMPPLHQQGPTFFSLQQGVASSHNEEGNVIASSSNRFPKAASITFN